MYISFGDRVILLRKKKKLNQEQLAKKLDIPVKDLAEYEDDKVLPPLNIAVRIADILDTSLDFLACRIDDQPSTLLLKWSAQIDSLSDRSREVLFEAMDAIINSDKLKALYDIK